MRLIYLLIAMIIAGCSAEADPTAPATRLIYDPPTQNVAGDPLIDLQGFVMYCGGSPGTYTTIRNVPDPNKTEFTFAELGLTDGDWYCAVTAYNLMGESGYSNEVFIRLAGGVAPPLFVPQQPGLLRAQ